MDIEDRIGQLETDIRVLKDNLLNYICQVKEKDPDPQWTNARLEALEAKVKQLEQKQNPEKYNGTE